MDHQETPDNNNSMLTLVLGIQIRSEDKTPNYSQDIDLHTPPQFEVGSIDCSPSATEMRDSGATFRPNVSSCCLAVMVFMLTTGVWVAFMASCFVRLKRRETYGWHCQRYRKDLDRPLALSKKTALVKQQISEHLAYTGLKEDGSLQEKKPSIHLGIDAPTKKSKSYDSDGENFLHALYTRFANFRPRPTVLTAFPASRRDQKQGQGSGGRDPAHRDPSPQRSPPTQQQWPPDSIHGMPWSTFRHEMHRMGTFNNLTATLPVSALKLAQAGFLCLPGGAIACYFCGLRRDEWRAGESPLDVHRQLQGTCPVVTSGGSENQAENSMQEQHLQQLMVVWSLSRPPFLPDDSLGQQTTTGEVTDARGAITQPLQPVQTPTVGAARAQTSRGQTGDLSEDGHSASPLALAGAQASASGFTPASAVASPNQTRDIPLPGASAPPLRAQTTGGSTGRQSGSQQQPRLGLMGGSAASANPGGSTPILDGTAQPESPRSTAQTPGDMSRAGQQVVTYQQLGIVTDSPKRPNMAMVNSRLASFTNWPADHSHTPLQLTDAGFFYGGYADCGRCFFCGGGLKSWDPPDNPWVEHARWFPRCAYVRQCQGQDFIDVVQELNDGGRRSISLNEVRETINQRRADGERIQEPVVDPAITSVLELGVSRESVDAAVQRLQGEGHMLTADRLYDSIQTDGPTAAGSETPLPSASDTVTETGEVSELVAENSEMRQQRMCKICLDKESSIVFLPCGHLVSCPECSPALMHCPMCRQRVKGRVRAFPA